MKTKKTEGSNPLKLSKFQLDQLSAAEMNAIKAGSGSTSTNGGSTVCTGSDHDSGSSDSD